VPGSASSVSCDCGVTSKPAFSSVDTALASASPTTSGTSWLPLATTRSTEPFASMSAPSSGREAST
jgi:hypothetical protein